MGAAEIRGGPARRARSGRWYRRRPMMIAALLVVIAVAVAAGLLLWPRGESRWPPEVPPVPAGGIGGYAFQDRNGNGTKESDEPVLPRWKVSVFSTGPLPIASTQTDEAGAFAMASVPNVTPGVAALRLQVAPVMEGPAAEDLPADSSLQQTFDATIGASVTLAVRSYRKCLTPDQCPGLRPPDLVPQLTSSQPEEYPPPTETIIDTTTEPGRVLLRFATSTANLGGLLHVVGLPPAAGTTEQRVQQRVYGDGVVLIRDAGTFVFHAEHHHFHIADFEHYQLRSRADNTVVAKGTKLSFCLTDIEAVQPVDRKSGDVFLDLPPLECGDHEQGINTGYADYYGSKLDGQWIDVTDVPSGPYWLEFTADPDQRLLESDTSNNTQRFELDYRHP